MRGALSRTRVAVLAQGSHPDPDPGLYHVERMHLYRQEEKREESGQSF